MRKKTGEKSVFDLIESFVDELICGGIQRKKPKAIPNVRNGKGKKNGKA